MRRASVRDASNRAKCTTLLLKLTMPCRFRRDPAAYLARLEEKLTKPSLPT